MVGHELAVRLGHRAERLPQRRVEVVDGVGEPLAVGLVLLCVVRVVRLRVGCRGVVRQDSDDEVRFIAGYGRHLLVQPG